jgi:rod shape-determining protein MreC
MVLAVLLAFALALIATDYLGGSAPLRAMGGAVFGTAERAVRSVTEPIARIVERAAGPAGSSRQIQGLEREVIRLRAQLSIDQLSRQEYAQLAALRRLRGPDHNRIVDANVIAVGQGYEQAVTLDVGSRDGIKPEETVLNAWGLVGTVVSTSPWTCTVLLASGPTAIAGVRLTGSGQMGWVTGTAKGRSGQDLLRLHVLGASTALARGQQLVTAASVGNRPYVAGIPVGVVIRVDTGAGLTVTALVRPFVDFSALDVVGVVVPPGQQRAGG